MDVLAVPWHHSDTTGVVLQNTGVSRESTELEAKIRTNYFGSAYDANVVGDRKCVPHRTLSAMPAYQDLAFPA